MLICEFAHLTQMESRVEEIREAVGRYPYYEFVPLKLEDCFDPDWWASVTGSSSGADLQATLEAEGMPFHSSRIHSLITH